jgi:3-dehydroquinate synthase
MIIALGGGVIGDLTGFAASILRRGIDFIQVPTTFLAQVDSSVGGKTGINTRQGKNLVGAFHQPRLVLADISALATLPRRQLLAGYAEVVKYGLIDDAEFFEWLEKRGPDLLAGDLPALQQAIRRSCAAKARIVSQDERESGKRALLNLGHTFGHALEAETGYGDDLYHGEAVAMGISLAFDLSVRLGLCPRAEAERVHRHFAAAGLPKLGPRIGQHALSAEVLLAHMAQDKKVKDGKVAFVLTYGIGKSFSKSDVPETEVLATLRAALAAPEKSV